MHKEILTKEQSELLPVVKSFSKNFGMVGGTAIALHIGHRHSIDFDLFTDKSFDNNVIKRKISKQARVDKLLYTTTDQFNLIVNNVKVTFFKYDFKIDYGQKLDDIIKIPDLLTLSAMKAYALGMRAKWKDYVDLYFIIKEHYSIDKITKKAKQIFGKEFNERMFRTQLSYFDDVDYREEVIYLPGFEVSDKEVKKALIEFSLKN
ncbi:MAG: hypothetical protein UV02_C0015G0003 [Candidatus Kuenenbacteria bacterium GW2011_GWA2_42_15]|uniref:Nucleotidyl transferase AbiEii toxin, Type IV TA system n=3 Tax=Candidatus Kueneniibacteriota TaxID=1752740 RepID=A0A0G0Z0W5_9BACT|nr:MAG: hypothetical protein UV02_C0015G0003 [Candidatus Kuenenbacteria bacterium GW2011_GWA2_42_15]OGG91683.1 MAG: hypothetical protein A3H55_03420 [Candidatus Kuenenbacteria bacterium RIFCSPLOWO2_02_FULL_42_16]OGG95837.1 MAG: hypothetical protein A2V95_01655 [Candidatus Kuenenbacteria bacterium RBG_16_41_7]